MITQMSEKATTSSASPEAQTFTLAKKLKQRLPEPERAGADIALWEKSGGLCALCGRALDPADAEADHRIPQSGDGPDTLSNLYLAHKTCNRSRGNLEFDLARPVVEFKAFSDERKVVTFDDVLDRYLVAGGKTARQPIKWQIKGKVAVLDFGMTSYTVPVSIDPATGVRFFFVDVPTEFIKNDTQVQPRYISYGHVRALAIDFASRPVHEPSNCRLVATGKDTADLLQFDGQHKTTAQILLGRETIPTKIYVQPEVSMIQALVLKIQQEIKKQPLTKSDTLAKLGDVIKRRLDQYLASGNLPHTEKGFVASQPPAEQAAVRKEYQQELLRLVYFDPTNELAQVVKPGGAGAPTTDKVVIEKVIKPLLHMELISRDMEAAGGRDTERELVILVLNTISRKMLPPAWSAPGNELARRRAQNFFYQASIAFWMEILIDALRYVTQRIRDPLFLDPLEQKQEDQVIEVVEKLCDLPLWSTDDQEDLRAMRSNTPAQVKERFKQIDFKKLIPN